MKNGFNISLAFLLSCMLLLFISCTDKNQGLQKETLDIQLDPKAIEGWVTYEKDGLVVQHPTGWKLDYDKSPALYADRAVGFEIAEDEFAVVYVFKDSNLPISAISDPFLGAYKLYENKDTQNLEQKKIYFEDIEGFLIYYDDAFITPPTKTEISFYKIKNASSSIFSTFIMNNDSPKENRIMQLLFSNSILLN